MRQIGMLAVVAMAGLVAGASGGPLVNPGFEEPVLDGTIPGWTYDRDDAVATVAVVPGEGVGGTQALYIEKRSAEKVFQVKQRLRLAPGGHYRVSCRIRTADHRCRDIDLTGATMRIRHLVNGKCIELPAQSASVVTDTSGGWARALGHIDPPADSEGVDVVAWIQHSVTGRFWFDDFKIEPRVDPPPPEPTRADAALVDEAGCLLVDGKPFLPLGFYTEAWDPFTVSNLDLVASGPFNALVPYSFPDRRQMDLCAARGLKVLYNANVYYGTRWAFGKVRSEEEEPAWTERTVAAFKDHPALLGWYVNDEFAVAFHDRLVARNRLVKSLDPRHVTWGVFMEPNNARRYLDCHDVMGVDPYCIGKAKEANLMRCYEHPSAALRAVKGQRAVWQVIQAFDWGMFGEERLKRGTRAPTREEMSAMTQLAIAGGANGIFYLSTTALASPVNGAEFHRRWADVLAAANEVKANEATILSPPGPAVEDVSDNGLRVRTWNVGGRAVALVVNGTYRPVRGTIGCAGCAPMEVNLGVLAHGYYVLQK